MHKEVWHMLHEPSPPPVGSGSGTCLGPCKQTPSGTSPESLHKSVPRTLPAGAGEGEGEGEGEGGEGHVKHISSYIRSIDTATMAVDSFLVPS